MGVEQGRGNSVSLPARLERKHPVEETGIWEVNAVDMGTAPCWFLSWGGLLHRPSGDCERKHIQWSFSSQDLPEWRVHSREWESPCSGAVLSLVLVGLFIMMFSPSNVSWCGGYIDAVIPYPEMSVFREGKYGAKWEQGQQMQVYSVTGTCISLGWGRGSQKPNQILHFLSCKINFSNM